MTTDECVIIAMRECGYGEKKIKHGRKSCDAACPNTLPLGAEKIPDDLVRPFIERIKLLIATPKSEFIKIYSAVCADFEERSKQN